MMDKEYLLFEDHCDNIKTGLNLVYEMVSKTMGPAGSNVFIERQGIAPLITKDGATVADNIYCNNERYASVVNLVKSITRKAAMESGDGTTTTTVLSNEIYHQYNELKNEFKNHRILLVTKYLRKLVDKLVIELKKYSKEITTKKELEEIIMISTNQDEYITKMLLECLDIKNDKDVKDAINKDIFVSFSRRKEDYIEKVTGSKYDASISNNGFYNNKARTKAELEKPLMFLTTAPINNMQQIIDLLTYAKNLNRPIILVAPEFDNLVEVALLSNKLRFLSGDTVGLDVTAVIAPGQGGTHTEDFLEDIAVLAGCKVSKPESVYSFDHLTIQNLKALEEVVGRNIEFASIDNVSMTIKSNTDKSIINERINELSKLHKETESAVKYELLERRIGKLKNGISTLYITADSDVELTERKDRIDDAIGAIKSALDEGYVIGSGYTFLALRQYLMDEYEKIDNQDERFACIILINALATPFFQLLSNAGININTKEVDEILDIKDYDELNKNGISLLENKYNLNLLESGIIDPTKVLRCALQYSVSLVSTLISSSSSVIYQRNESNVK